MRAKFKGNAWQKNAKRNGIGAVNSAQFLIGQQQENFCGFDQAITCAIYFTFHSGKKIDF